MTTPIKYILLITALILVGCSGSGGSSSGSSIDCFESLQQWEASHGPKASAGKVPDEKFHRQHGYRRVPKNGIKSCYPNAPINQCTKSCGTPH